MRYNGYYNRNNTVPIASIANTCIYVYRRYEGGIHEQNVRAHYVIHSNVYHHIQSRSEEIIHGECRKVTRHM